jgi:hypothetical protein
VRNTKQYGFALSLLRARHAAARQNVNRTSQSRKRSVFDGDKKPESR